MAAIHASSHYRLLSARPNAAPEWQPRSARLRSRELDEVKARPNEAKPKVAEADITQASLNRGIR